MVGLVLPTLAGVLVYVAGAEHLVVATHRCVPVVVEVLTVFERKVLHGSCKSCICLLLNVRVLAYIVKHTYVCAS